ncbi:hypothetical protein [Micromonospora sp. IBHARD004]|uniref:hypothetical protein n=1 Tax=Micromonospora sp. IBHARD004 TaxID=3457764 RepID=UPI0040582470
MDWCREGEARVLMLESEGVTGYIVTVAVGWCEGVLSDLQPSFFNRFSAYDPVWPAKPLTGVGGGFDIASPQEVAEAFLAGLPEGVRRERYRYVHLLTAVTEQDDRRSRHNLGLFLTDTDPEEAKRLVRLQPCHARTSTVASSTPTWGRPAELGTDVRGRVRPHTLSLTRQFGWAWTVTGATAGRLCWCRLEAEDRFFIHVGWDQ